MTEPSHLQRLADPSRPPRGRGDGARKPTTPDARKSRRSQPTGADPRNIFVIHGRDEQARLAIFELLRALDLRPLEWESMVAATKHTCPSLLQVVDIALVRAHAVVALLTPEDVVSLHPDLHGATESPAETATTMQSRPNVYLELGMALHSCRDRTIVLHFGQQRPVNDLNGINFINFDGSETAIGKLVHRLKTAGCAVDDSGTDWRNTSRFAHLAAYRRTPPA